MCFTLLGVLSVFLVVETDFVVVRARVAVVAALASMIAVAVSDAVAGALTERPASRFRARVPVLYIEGLFLSLLAPDCVDVTVDAVVITEGVGEGARRLRRRCSCGGDA